MALGNFFGGMAQGLQASRANRIDKQNASLRERAIGLQERQLGYEMERNLKQEANQRINSTFGVIGELIKGYKDTQVDSGGLGLLSLAVGDMESGGDYSSLGPDVVRDGGFVDNALGKYGVMRSNLGPWTKEVFGQEMSEGEFLGNPAAQEAVFQAKMGEYMKRYGSFEDALSVWHSGVPLDQAIAEGRADVNMSTADYVKSVTSNMKSLSQRKFAEGVAPLFKDIRELGQKAGIDTSSLERQAEALIKAMPTGIERAIAEGRQEGAKNVARARTEAAGGLPKEIKGEFAGLVQLYQTTEDPEAKKFYLDRLNRLTSEQSGFTMETTPDGGIRITQGGSGIPSGEMISPSLRNELTEADQELQSGIDNAIFLLDAIQKDPTLAGVLGTVRRGVETVKGVGADLGIDVDPIIDRLKAALGDDAVEKLTGADTTRFTDVIAAQLVYGVARGMQPQGRLLASTIESAREQVNITGLRSSQQVEDQLRALVQVMDRSRTDIQRRLESGVEGQAKTPRKELSAPPPDNGFRKSPSANTPPKTEGQWQTIDGIKVRAR